MGYFKTNLREVSRRVPTRRNAILPHGESIPHAVRVLHITDNGIPISDSVPTKIRKLIFPLFSLFQCVDGTFLFLPSSFWFYSLMCELFFVRRYIVEFFFLYCIYFSAICYCYCHCSDMKIRFLWFLYY